MRKVWLVLFLLVSGCASTKALRPGTARDALFPPGTYRHEVTLTVSGKERHFSGLVAVTAREIRVVGLGVFGATLFRVVKERASGSIEVSVYQDALKKHEKELRGFFEIVSGLLTLPANGKIPSGFRLVRGDSRGYPLELRTEGERKDVEIVFASYDANRIPDRIEIRLPKFKVLIEVTGYEL